MAIKSNSKQVKKKRNFNSHKIWPREVRSSTEILIEHQMIAMSYVKARYCHD